MADSLVKKLLNDDIYNLPNLWLTPYVCLAIKGCNAHEFRNFSKDVWIGFEKKPGRVMGPSLCEIFINCFLSVFEEMKSIRHGEKNMKHKTICCLEEFLKCLEKGDKHASCLKKMATSEEKLKEAEIQAVLAVHLFSPILAEGEVIADCVSYSSSSGKGPAPECLYCKEAVVVGNTNFGVKKLWHGRGDIVIKTKECKKVVKVDSGIVQVEDEGQGEPAAKKSKLQEVEADGYSFAEVKTSDISDLAVHQLIKEHSYTQALSQTIVNAFLVAKLNTKLKNHLIPSFFVTAECLLINFYNVDKDILLVQSKPLVFFKDGKINLETILSLWMALNFERFEVFSMEENYQKSGFRDFLTSNGVINEYEKEVEDEFASVQKPKTASSTTDYYVDIAKTNKIRETFMGHKI